MQDYVGSRLTLKIFNPGEVGYTSAFNDSTIKPVADLSFTSAPINGGTEILDASITSAKLAAGVLTALQASLTRPILANDTYDKGRNHANNADLNMVKVTTGDLLHQGINWDGLRLANQKVIGGTTVGAVAQDWMQTSSTDTWEFLSTAYTQTMLAKATNTYDIGDSTHVYNKGWLKNARIVDYSSTVDFYAQGTWTPVIKGVTTAGTGTYTTNVGFYTRIGRGVWLDFNIIWTAHTGTGNMVIDGAPFTSANDGTTYSNWAGMPNITFSNDPGLVMAGNSTQIQFATNVTGSSGAIAMDTAGQVYGTFFYRI